MDQSKRSNSPAYRVVSESLRQRITRGELVAGDAEMATCDAIRMEVLAGARDRAHLADLRGLLARCVQHEHDHCQGVLFIDRMTRAHQLLTATKEIGRAHV